MASKGVELSLLLVLALMLCHGATAQSGCTNVVMGLAPCLNYVTGNSSTPSSSCCSKLANVVQSQPLCLCALLNDGGSSVGVNINQTLALSLPGACNVQTPPVSRCNGTSTIKICVFFFFFFLGNRGLGGWKINLYSIKLCNFFIFNQLLMVQQAPQRVHQQILQMIRRQFQAFLEVRILGQNPEFWD